MLELFQNVAHKMDLRTAVEQGILAPIRCVSAVYKRQVIFRTVGVEFIFGDNGIFGGLRDTMCIRDRMRAALDWRRQMLRLSSSELR